MQVLWFGWVFLHTPVGHTPFPPQGFIAISFLVEERRGLLLCPYERRFSIAASL